MDFTEKTAKEWLSEKKLPHFRTGSREICNPPVMNTDVDFVVLNKKNVDFSEWLDTTGTDDSYGTSLTFRTYRSGEVNLIIVNSNAEFTKWHIATVAAKALNMVDKHSRIVLFQGVLYGNWGDD
jgi:4-hydroxyphenylpyruvate dioxygenase-like putative hemolysin